MAWQGEDDCKLCRLRYAPARMSPASFRSCFCALVAAVFLSGCAGSPIKPFYPKFGFLPWVRPKVAMPEPPPTNLPAPYWAPESAVGEPMILVRLGEQRAYFYHGNKVVGVTRISSGKKGFTTPPGYYRVIQKNRNHVSNLYGDYVGADGAVVKANVDVGKDAAPEGSSFRGAKMPYFLRFHGGYGLHAGRVPNQPASHGCVRLPSEMARHFFESAQMGTPVQVE